MIKVLLKTIEPNLADSGSDLFKLIKEMFAESPKDRPNAKQVESRLERVAMKALTQDLLDSMEELSFGTNVFRTKLHLEKTRISAWAGLLGLTRLGQQTVESTFQLPTPFIDLFEIIEDVIKDTKNRRFESDTQNEISILSSMHRFNDTIYGKLPEHLRANADGLFQILFTMNNENLPPILDINRAVAHEYEDTRRIAEMRHMSLLMQRNEHFHIGVRLEISLIQPDQELDDFNAHPPTRWYYYGDGNDEKRRVLVESRNYRQNSNHDIEREEIRRHGEVIFRRVQELITMLQKPKPTGFRVLDCVGAYHDHERQKFGIVYDFPKDQVTPFRLHYMFKGQRGSKKTPAPTLGQKFALATSLAVCLQSLHVSS